MLKILLSYVILSSPLGIDWNKKYDTAAPTLEGYSHYSGSLRNLEVTYLGTESLLSMETELQINFYKKKIVEALLILGPTGISKHNCLVRYSQVIKYISKKYGPRKYTLDEKDPVVSELVYFSSCTPFNVGLRVITTTWETPEFIIEAKLIGEHHEYFIEIKYIKSNIANERLKSQKSKIIKKL